MPSAIAGLSSTPAHTGTTKSLSSSDFLNLMIQQLSQQDPMNPTDSNQLLGQMAQISTLQSNADMQASLAGLTLQQSIGSGGNLIGKTIQGLDTNGNALTGVVTSIKVSNKKIFLELDSGHELPMENVTQIAPTGAAASANPTATPATSPTTTPRTTPTTTPTPTPPTPEQLAQQLLAGAMSAPAGQQRVRAVRDAMAVLTQ